MRFADRGRRLVVVGLMLTLVGALASCGVNIAPRQVIYADGTRGCREAEHDVAIWSKPGAVPAGADIVVYVDHGALLDVMAEEIAFGVRYFEVEYANQVGWLPELYSETISPVCE